jgi:hypothetical protein
MGTGEMQLRPGVGRGRVDPEAHYIRVSQIRRRSTCNPFLPAAVMRHRLASVVVNSTDAEDIPRVMGASTAVFASIISAIPVAR